MLGQLLGDFATRDSLESCDKEIKRGVRGHRELDEFTDSHPSFIEGCKLLDLVSKRYSPVVMDILLDYYLVKNWSLLCEEVSFNSFLDSLYSYIELKAHLLPARMEKPAIRMSSSDWFSQFSTFEGFSRVLYYTSKRVRYPEWILNSSGLIHQKTDELEYISLQILQDDKLLKFSSECF